MASSRDDEREAADVLESMEAAQALSPRAAAAEAAAAAAAAAEGLLGFPTYVGHRRPLLPGDPLFEAGNEEREVLAKQAARTLARGAAGQLSKETALAGSRDLSRYLTQKFECSVCRASLPTAHLLSCHVSEMHDSFFAAQAARRMRVYCCLVEGCGRKFSTIEERKQHLADHHRFPRSYNFDRIHLRRKKGQIRPLPAYQHASPPADLVIDAATGRMDEDGDTVLIAGRVAAKPRAKAPVAGDGGDGGNAGDGSGAPAPAPRHEEVVAGLSRLSMAAQEAAMPQNISFGRHAPARGMPGLGRGRGGRGRGARAGTGAAAGTESAGAGTAGVEEGVQQ